MGFAAGALAAPHRPDAAQDCAGHQTHLFAQVMMKQANPRASEFTIMFGASLLMVALKTRVPSRIGLFVLVGAR